MEYNKIDQFVRDESEWGGYCQYKEKYTGRSIGGKKSLFFLLFLPTLLIYVYS